MELLKKRIQSEGKAIGKDIVKVDMFLNHQIDVELIQAIGQEFHNRFKDKQITKILTIEASGIPIACMTALYFNVPVLFGKKYTSETNDNSTYVSNVYSFTKKQEYNIRISKEFLHENDKVLIIDDFLANGQAVIGLLDIVNQAKSTVCGVGIVIEKGFQPGRKNIEEKGLQVESLAIIDSIKDGIIYFI